MVTTQELERIQDAPAYTSTGEKVGKIKKVFLDDRTGQPKWATVHTGLFGLQESWVPLTNAQWGKDGLVVGYDKDVIRNAPKLDADREHVSAVEEQDLCNYYNVEYGQTGQPRPSGRGAKSSDDAMTRSEEHLDVGTRTDEVGRARLRKYVVEETEQVDVPVRKERVRVERQPITDANREDALRGPEISEAEHEVVLHEERPVVGTRTEPKERVRLSTDVENGTETVQGKVRKERIEADGALDERDGRTR